MFKKSIQAAVCMPSISTWVNLSVPGNFKVFFAAYNVSYMGTFSFGF
jgi:hypothetical protein